MAVRIAAVAALACVIAGLIAPAAAPAQTITVYRCVDGSGRLSLRDTPCPAGQKQQARSVPKISDPPRRAITVGREPITPASSAPPAPQVIVINNAQPQPMYECVTPDGGRYSSDSPQGNPRWVPLWTLGYPVEVERTLITPGGGHLRYSNGRVDGGFSTGGIQRVIEPTLAGYGAGAWVRDECRALPQSETCARLSDELSELRTRFFNAMPSERDRITIRERGITARLAADCGR